MAIRSIQHFALTVPDLNAGRQYYNDIGLIAEERDGAIVAHCDGRQQDEVILFEGNSNHYHHVSFGTNEDGLGEIKQKLEAAGTKLLDPPTEWPEDGLWFRDPDDALIHIGAVEPAPWRDDPPWLTNSPGHYDRVGVRAVAPVDIEIRPRRFGHMLLFTTDIEAKTGFFTDILGMKVSDSVETFIDFFYASSGSDHHILAFGLSSKPGFQHAGFELGNVDEVGMIGRKLREKGYIHCWGPGRHGPGSNYFQYFRDPWNSITEFFCDMDYIAADSDWQPKTWLNSEAAADWGPDLPADFLTNFEALGST
ncbi:MAG: VOC family protein [Rhodospirillales bacterium]|jgi:catechol 2,3-dioxygenase-like lactoylglutathione lyase family enzyme|nr:hypothetical protein [Rhodospirillaceae bacterium]MDP6426801.1 VOC family protein [Rhodospirillales bacterium]MDP6645839.1 VOC family protein [Rhodospirillales bacterium]MDP6843147.1 VOC family protein [Rhodospirillales bacterium]|tara:strand:+ start:599 stop:1522 length:924 start_codon:yes stop_codon:yes gene_type:complete